MPAFPWATTKVAVWKGRLDVFFVRCAVSFLASDFSRQAFYLVYILKGRINWIRRGATRFIPYRADSLGLSLAIGREVPLGGTEESIP